jgi:hypothetical protein
MRVSLAHEFVAEMLGVHQTRPPPPANLQDKCIISLQRRKVSTLDGAVTLQDWTRKKSAGASGSHRNDNFTPRLHVLRASA